MGKGFSLVVSVIVFVMVCTIQCCKHDAKEEPLPFESEIGEEFSGGDLTVNDASVNAFGIKAAGLSNQDYDQFVLGNSFFKTNWIAAPASASARDGLGPLFNTNSCSGCHLLDGRGRPPLYPGEELVNGLLFRLSVSGSDAHGAPLEEPHYGGQFNNAAIANVTSEGNVRVDYTTISGTYKDGTPYELRNPVYTFENLGYGALAADFMFSPRLAPQNPGLGLLEAIKESDILAKADPDDANGDGISGRPNMVWNYLAGNQAIGRFGWKANQPNLLQQTAAAFSGDIGITTSLFPNQNLTIEQQLAYSSIADGGKPELTNLAAVTFYCQTLAIPMRRNWKDQTVLRGKELFSQAKCASCHSPYFVTGTHTVSYLSNQKIRPYTDLLLHDMGADLADNRPDFQATGSEWRTPPLWGLGLIATVSKYRFMMHDGRARTLEEAILWHGGEGEFSKKAFVNMDKTDRDALIAFLESL